MVANINGLQNLDMFDDFELEVEKELEEQALNYTDEGEATICLDDLMGPSYGSGNESSVEVENRGGLRYVNIDFSGDSFDVTQTEYEVIKSSIDAIIQGESDESVNAAIDKIVEFGSRAVKVVFSFARKFDLDNVDQYNDLKDLMSALCLRSLSARDTIIAVLIGANSKPHIRLAMVTAGEVKERNALPYLSKNLKDVDLFDVAFDALLDIRDNSIIEDMLDSIDATADRDEERRGFLLDRTNDFVDFGTDIINPVLNRYNTCDVWNKPVFGGILNAFEEDIIQPVGRCIEVETDVKKLESLCMLLGRLKSDKAADMLVDMYRSGRNKKAAMVGLGHLRSDRARDLQKDILREGTESSYVLEEAMISLAFVTSVLDKEEVIEIIRHYLRSNDPRMRICATFSLARLDDSKSLDAYMNLLCSENMSDRKNAARLINRLKTTQITEMCKRCLDMPQSKAMYVLNAFTRRKTFEKESGRYLLELLNRSSYLLKVEIYNIIGNTANTKNQIISSDVLYRERDKAVSKSEKMVLDEIIARIKKVKVMPNFKGN